MHTICDAPTVNTSAPADFVRAACLHRDARLANATLYMEGPNTTLPGDTVYLFQCPTEAPTLMRTFATTIPDALVAARDAEAVRSCFLERDAAYDAGGPWWIKPLGVAPADLPVATPATDMRAAAHAHSTTACKLYFG